jgi:DNA processing protein
MAEAGACLECLRRSWLLAALGPYVEKIATGAVGSRSPELLRLSNEDLIEVAAPKVAGQMLARIAALTEERLVEELLLAECWACCRHGDLYPSSLRDATDAPWALIGRGDPALLDGLEPYEAVTVVGARRATSYGREVARELGRELASAGMVVVSGLAFGIDACAHRGALDAGRTIAVLGCGPDVAYPASNRSLRRICESGLVLSELPPGATPWRWTFPARNRIMAALAGMTVVVEAAARSGSLITTDLAADLGRDLGGRARPRHLPRLRRSQRPPRRRRLRHPRRPGRTRRDARPRPQIGRTGSANPQPRAGSRSRRRRVRPLQLRRRRHRHRPLRTGSRRRPRPPRAARLPNLLQRRHVFANAHVLDGST